MSTSRGPAPAPDLPPTPSVAPPGRSRRRRLGVVAIAVGVAAALVVAGLVATGVLPWWPRAPGPAIPFSQARSDAAGSAASGLGGSWVANAAVAIVARVPTSVPVNLSVLLGSGCAVTALPGVTVPTQLLVPAYAGSFGSGLSPLWLVAVSNPTDHEVVLVEVLDRQGTPLAQVTGSSCLSSGPLSRPLPGATVDSPQVAGLAWSAAGQAFVADDPSLTVLVLAALGGGLSYAGQSFGSIWGIAYAPCEPFLGGTVSEDSDVAALNLTTGALIAFYSNLAVNCPL